MKAALLELERETLAIRLKPDTTRVAVATLVAARSR